MRDCELVHHTHIHRDLRPLDVGAYMPCIWMMLSLQVLTSFDLQSTKLEPLTWVHLNDWPSNIHSIWPPKWPAWAIWELCINSWCIWIMQCMALMFSSSLDLHYTIWFITPCSNHIFWRYNAFGNIFKRSYNMNRNTTWLTPCSCLQMEIQYGSHPARTRWDANWWETNRAQFLCLVLL